jgi:DNA-binding MarR family transcriptional regulator
MERRKAQARRRTVMVALTEKGGVYIEILLKTPV